MIVDSLVGIFHRDLTAVRREIESYPDEATVWAAVPGLPNSGGILVRHLCGNLQHFVGTVLGATSYRRDREAEFAAPAWPRSRLISECRVTEETIAATLATLSPDRLGAPYPAAVANHHLRTTDFLIHLAVHCGFHLGQLDYHRRAVTEQATSVGPMAIAALASAREPLPGQ
jgi:Protein of unknown function (DUF664)